MRFDIGRLCSFFYTDKATRTSYPDATRVLGREEMGVGVVTTSDVSLQPATMKDLQFIEDGGGRIIDVRRVFIRTKSRLDMTDRWVFAGIDGVFATRQIDQRTNYGYTEVLVERLDV